MNCVEWEERVALYAGGDLAAGEAVFVERHLGECDGCQVFASGMRQALEAMREAHREIPAEAHFAAVRTRVMERVARPHRPTWWYALAAAAVLLVALTVRPEWPPVPPGPLAVVQAPAPPAGALTIPKRLEKASRRAGVRRARTGQVLIKLVTDDPDVVIYWIAETKGD
jgi:anti-sigma factor RsiW